MVEFETHTGRTWKCKKEDVLEILVYPGNGLKGENSHYHIRTTDPTGKYIHHVWRVTKETGERVSRETGIPIGNTKVKSGIESKNDYERDDAIHGSQQEDRVELREKVVETHKAVLGKVVTGLEETEKTGKTWKTWIPKSVIGENGRIAEWFQEKVFDRFANG